MKVIKYLILYLVPVPTFSQVTVPVPLVKKLRFPRFRFRFRFRTDLPAILLDDLAAALIVAGQHAAHHHKVCSGSKSLPQGRPTRLTVSTSKYYQAVIEGFT
jgi:hypothetical protein